MLPISDRNPTRGLPVMNLVLIGLNFLVFIYELSLPDRALLAFVSQWGVTPGRLLQAIGNPLAAGAGQAFLTLITSQFIHANFVHILGNMLYLWIFGDNIEDILGSFTYLIYYLVFGVIAGLTQTFLLAPFLGGMGVPSIGASGAIAGVLGAYLVLFPGARIRAIVPPLIFLSFSVPAIIIIGLWFVLQLFSGVGSLTPEAAQGGGVAYWAHIGGFIAGMVMILPFWGRSREIKAAESQSYFAGQQPEDRFRY